MRRELSADLEADLVKDFIARRGVTKVRDGTAFGAKHGFHGYSSREGFRADSRHAGASAWKTRALKP